MILDTLYQILDTEFMMDNINRFMRSNPKYQRLSGPLRAAQVCDTTRSLAHDRFAVVSFAGGLLTLSVESAAAAANLQTEIPEIIKEVNEKLSSEQVKKIRIKII